MALITVIGRGHSGTRAMSHTLSASGVFMGAPLNDSGDLLPPQAMYQACRVFARFVKWRAGLEWDWDEAQRMEVPAEFKDLLRTYLKSVHESTAEHRGWKIPETTLVCPWIVRLFPEIKYIFWIRNPRDCILGKHLTDDLNDFGILYPPTEDAADEGVMGQMRADEYIGTSGIPCIRLRRAISWKYQYDLVQATPKPEHWIEVRFEDFVLRQEETLARLEGFLGIPLARIPVQPETVDRWKLDQEANYYDFFAPAMVQYGYEIPAG